MLVGVVLVVDECAHRDAVPRPGRGDEVAVGVVGGIGIERATERDAAVDREVVKVGPPQRAVDEMQREHCDASASVAEGARIDVGHVVGLAAAARGIEDDAWRASQNQCCIGAGALRQEQRDREESQSSDPHDPLPSQPRPILAGQYAFFVMTSASGVVSST